MPIGPGQLLVVSFDNRTSPEILAELNRLRENQVIRLIDALAVQKNLDGTLAALQWSDLPAGEAEGLGATVGALLGLGADGEAGMEAGAIAGMDAGSHGHLIDESEVWDVADAIEPGSAAHRAETARALRAASPRMSPALRPGQRRRAAPGLLSPVLRPLIRPVTR